MRSRRAEWRDIAEYGKRRRFVAIVVVDTGSGNLRSVEKAVQAAAARTTRPQDPVVRSSDPNEIRKATRVILPGQGAFGDGARAMQGGIGAAVTEFIRSGHPFFGICIGLQLLFESSEEAPGVAGLGYFQGQVKKLVGGKGIKIPHMGWNRLRFEQPHSVLGRCEAEDQYFYFVHSFHAVPADSNVLLATVEYGANRVTAAVGRENVFATQFHPEKSQSFGLRLLTEFLNQ